jgi:TatD DNase family protein
MEKSNLSQALNLPFTDTHCHLYDSKFSKDRNEVVERAAEGGVERILLPNIDSTSIDAMMEVESKYSACEAAMGLHPCSVGKNFEKQLYEVESWLAKRPFVSVGEIGLDRYWDTTYYEHQVEAFKIQCAWAKQYKLPVMIHVRDAMTELLDLLGELQDGSLSGVVHCFTGTLAEAEKAIELGFYLGIGGVATFKNGGLDSVIPEISNPKLILETDSPYLAPKPYRGKRNSPEYIPLIAQRVADLMQKPLDEVSQLTNQNANTLFVKKNV